MEQKLAATQEQPSSSEEEEEVSTEEEEDSSSEKAEQHDQTEPSVRSPLKCVPALPQPASSSEDDEEEHHEETEPSVRPPPPSKSEKMPTGATRGSQRQSGSSESRTSESGSSDSVEISDRKRARNPRSQPSVTPARSTMKSTTKNSHPTNDSRIIKRKLFQHKASDAPAEERIPAMEKSSTVEPKKLFQRVWTEEDEIALLKGVAEYWEKNGTDPCKVQNAFHDFIKESFNVNFSKSQLFDKIRRLKKKYENNARKGKNGQDPKFSNGHEKDSFELSKKIWATEGTIGGAPNPKSDITNSIQQLPLKANLLLPSPNANEVAEVNKFLGISESSEDAIQKGLQLVEASKREELKEKLNDLKFIELENLVKRTKLMHKQAKLVLEAVKSSNDL
ncbi:hypothetical protein L6164_026128 [Bauhinia variegata]|uniref:Uncharacterized protein n=1 Tax=Bauhinia variegata TaxID=167791 RepID=A0ACB9LP26_BAUVA|nr:hypothetical protein L6164_026128 [Bauhinia variegata]